eukprot:13039665-Ditylum_brightwellii.AAC.1
MQRPGKASDNTKAQNVITDNDNKNKSLMHSVAQLKDHVPSDVKSQSREKASDVIKSQYVLVQNESDNKSQMPIKAQLKDPISSVRMLKKHNATENRHLQSSETKEARMKGMPIDAQLKDH